MACDRFELRLDSAGRSYLKDLVTKHGIDGAATEINKVKIKPSACLEKMMEVVRQAPSIKALDTKEEKSMECGAIAKQVKNMLSLGSLPIEDIKRLYPELTTLMQEYNEKVLANMDEVLQSVEACVRSGKEKVDKYRPVMGHR